MRIEQLTFTRFLAAIAIVIYHYGKGSFFLTSEHFHFIFENANLGVSYFFVLSGFVMIIAYGRLKKLRYKNYYINRFSRIYPIYFIAILAIITIKHFSFETDEFVYNILLIQAWIPNMALTLNYPGWSLSVELLFYICFPLIFKLFKLYSTKKIVWLVLLIWLLTQVTFNLIYFDILPNVIYSNLDLMYFPPLHINQFLVGCTTGLLYLKTKKLKIPSVYNLLIILSLVSIIIVTFKFSHILNLHNGALAILFAPLIYFLSIDKSFLTTILSNSIFIFLGEISYSVYILQDPIFHIFSDNFIQQYLSKFISLNDVNIVFMFKTTCLVIAAAISYKYIEEPLRLKIKRSLNNKPTPR